MQQSHGPAVRRARVLVLLAQLVSCFAFVAPFRETRGFSLDDAWIHQVVARTFATTGTLGYRPGAHGAGATSYLWGALLSIGQRLHAAPVVFTDALAIIAALAAGQLLVTLLAERGDADDEGRTPAPLGIAEVVALALACAGGDLVWFAFSGMEATTVVALALGAIVFATRPVTTTRTASLSGLLAGATALTRPDFIPLGACLVALVYFRSRQLRVAHAVAAPWLLACALYFGSNKLLVGVAMPATLSGRRWLWIDSGGGGATFASNAVEFVFAWTYRLRALTFGITSNVPFWISVGLVGLGVVTVVRERRTGLVVLAAWTLLHFLVFLVMLPVPGHGGRYQPLVPVLWVLFTVLGSHAFVLAIVRAVQRRWSSLEGAAGRALVPAALVVALGPWVAILANGWHKWRSANADAVAHIHRTEEGMGLVVRALPSSARIATFDVGAIGYFAERPVLDLGALTDPRVAAALRQDRLIDLLREDGITHIVLPMGADDFPDLSNFGFRLSLAHNPRVEMHEVQSLVSPESSWLDGVAYTQNATIRQALYEATVTSCEAPAVTSSGAASSVDIDRISNDRRERLRRAFTEAASHGLCVRVRQGAAAEAAVGAAPAPEECWVVRLDADGEPLVGGPADATPSLATVSAELRRWIAPYVRAHDWGNAAAATLHVLTSVRQQHEPCFWTKLPPLDQPPGRGPPPPPGTPPREDLWWGLPLALFIATGGARSTRATMRSR